MLNIFSRTGLVALCVCLLGLSLAAPASAARKNPLLERQAKTMSDSAIKLIKSKGEAAFFEMNQKDGPWFKGGVGIFVSDEKGVELVNPADPGLVGKNLWDYKDPDGKLVIQEQWKIVKAKGKGWLDCKWNKPGESQASRCRVYVRGVKTGGKNLMVGAFYYLP